MLASEEKATSDCGMYSKAIRDLFLDFADTLTLGNPQIAKKKKIHTFHDDSLCWAFLVQTSFCVCDSAFISKLTAVPERLIGIVFLR